MGRLNLTEKELKLVKAHLAIFNQGCSGQTLADLKADNYSIAYVEDFQDRTDFSKEQVAGLIGSLEEKGVIAIDGQDTFTAKGWVTTPCYWLNENWFAERFEDNDVLIDVVDKELHFLMNGKERQSNIQDCCISDFNDIPYGL